MMYVQGSFHLGITSVQKVTVHTAKTLVMYQKWL